MSQNVDKSTLSTGALDTNKCGRRNIYTPESVDISLDGDELKKNEVENEIQGISRNAKSPNAIDMMKSAFYDAQLVENVSNIAKSEKEKKSSIYSAHKNFEDNNDISLNQSFEPAENYKFLEPSPLNVAKLKLSRQMNRSKLSNKQENGFMTPTNLTLSNKNRSLFRMTPRLSLMEFKELETKIEENCGHRSKRPQFNLTPIFSMPKKRQTLLYDECLLNDMKETKEKRQLSNKCFINDDAMEMMDDVPNESILQTPPKERKSRIPIPINSAVKINKSFSLIGASSNNQEELDEENSNLAESIEILRRQRKDTTSVQLELHPKLVPVVKRSIFEGSPITISDVSAFFEAQRKTNSDITQTEMRPALDKHDYYTLNPMENAKTNLENRFINLTSEDLDKTRISLVQLSYEGITGNAEDLEKEKALTLNDSVVIAEVDIVPEVRRKPYSDSYVPNISLVCRKCKRCQETILNESSSSSSQSFVLPELPPLPDIGLDRLRRLRRRPTIADVTVLLHRLNLELSTITISEDDSEIEDEAEDINCAVTKLIKKFEQDMMSFEMDLMGKQRKSSSEKLPFVLRLYALLRNNSANWIFDYQMQGRGILLFSHKKMLTFTLSLTFEEADPLGYDIRVNSVEQGKGNVPKKNWKPIDFFLEFQLKLNLPFNIHWLCKGNNEDNILEMLQEIDQVCLDTLKMGNNLQRICCTNQASIFRDGGRTFVRKILRKVVNSPNNDFKYVDKTEIKVELLNLKKLSFKDIVSPQLHHFQEDIHLLPTGLQFLKEFLPNPLYYFKDD